VPKPQERPSIKGEPSSDGFFVVFIAMPCRNSARFLAAALDSVRAQSRPDWQLYIADDGSTDGSSEIARDYAARDSRIHCIESRGGISAAVNAALSHLPAEACWISFLGSDDVWQPHTLECLIEAACLHEGTVGAHGLGSYIDASGEPIHQGELERVGSERSRVYNGAKVSWPVEKPTTFANLMCGNCVPAGSILVRRDIFERAGSLDEQLQLCEDWDMLLRVARYGDIAFVPRVVMSYRRHNANVSGNKVAMQRWEQRVRIKTACSPKTRRSNAASSTKCCTFNCRMKFAGVSAPSCTTLCAPTSRPVAVTCAKLWLIGANCVWLKT
jgi:glycosyltransferase involved in cell wall biosynthesis